MDPSIVIDWLGTLRMTNVFNLVECKKGKKALKQRFGHKWF